MVWNGFLVFIGLLRISDTYSGTHMQGTWPWAVSAGLLVRGLCQLMIAPGTIGVWSVGRPQCTSIYSLWYVVERSVHLHSYIRVVVAVRPKLPLWQSGSTCRGVVSGVTCVREPRQARLRVCALIICGVPGTRAGPGRRALGRPAHVLRSKCQQPVVRALPISCGTAAASTHERWHMRAGLQVLAAGADTVVQL